jgi:hypothetical protein
MPIAKFRMPDGRIGRFNVPDGTTPEQAKSLVESFVNEHPEILQESPAPEQDKSNWYDPDRLAANPLIRFATGAASPVLGAMEMIPGVIGDYFAKNNKTMSELVKQGKEKQSDATNAVGDLAEFGGTVLSPAFLKLGKLLPSAKTAGGLMKQGTVIGGIAGLTSPTGISGEEGAQQHVLNTGIGMATGGLLTPVIGSVAQGLGNIVAPIISKRATDSSAGKLAVKAAGKRAQDVVNALNTGSTNDIAAVTALPAKSSEFSALMDLMKGNKGSEYGNLSRAQEEARLAALKAISPDLAAAEARRTALSGKYYDKASKTVVDIDQELANLFDRMPPGTMEAAARIAKIEGRPFIIGQSIPGGQVPSGVLDASGKMIMTDAPAQQAKITGESLHYIKRALSDIANAADPAKGIGRDSQAAAREVLSDFINAFEERVPAYRIARKLYSELSKPVNQANVIKEMASILEKPGGGERVNAFLNVLGRGENALLKRSTGYPRYESGDLSKVLSPQQMAVVNAIANDLKSGMELSARNQEGMHGALDAIRASENKEIRAPNLVNYKVSLINNLLNRLEGVGGKRIETRLAELGMPGNQLRLAELMQAGINRPQGMLGDITRNQGGVIQGMLMGAQQ